MRLINLPTPRYRNSDRTTTPTRPNATATPHAPTRRRGNATASPRTKLSARFAVCNRATTYKINVAD
eukprot:7852895-Pyramimonas_sp.AAC.1